MTKAGYFITLEGGEGGGKSTQSQRLAAQIQKEFGRKVQLTREPGGAPGAEAIRELLVNGAVDRWSPLGESLLFAAARDEHLRHTIRPALERGEIVICDRFSDSTTAYQGAGGGVDVNFLKAIETTVVGATRPDLTFILDLPPEAGMARAASRGSGEDRFESKAIEFHIKLREEFLAIAKAEPQRCAVINADQDIDEVAAAIWTVAEDRLRTLSGSES